MMASKVLKPIDLPCSINQCDRQMSTGPSVELIGEGPYSFLMIRGLLNHGVNVTRYLVRGKPSSSIAYNSGVEVKTFKTISGLSRIIGDADYSFIFSLGLKIPEYLIKDGSFFNIHTSLTPYYEDDEDPIRAALRRRQTSGGVSIYRLTDGINQGGIVGQRRFDFVPEPPVGKYDKTLVDNIYQRTVIPHSVELLKEVVEREEWISRRARGV